MFTLSPTRDKLKFAFMMYDEEQEGAASKAEVLELLKAMAPHISERDRIKHASKMYSMHNLHSGVRITIDESIEYILKDEYAKELVPQVSSSDASSEGNKEKEQEDVASSRGSSSWAHSSETTPHASRRPTRDQVGS